jgi:hypothetical protein
MNPQGEAFDPEEDEPVLEVAWPHIQVQRSQQPLPAPSHGRSLYDSFQPERQWSTFLLRGSALDAAA